MNRQPIRGDWNALKGQVKEAFGKLTDDDLLVAEIYTDRVVGAIRERYGYTREQADQAWHAFATNVGVATMNGVDQTADPVKERIAALRGGVSPYDANRAAVTPDEARVREQAVIDAHSARREF